MYYKKKLLMGALAMGAGYALGRLKGEKNFHEIVSRTVASGRKNNADYSAFPPYMRPTTRR